VLNFLRDLVVEWLGKAVIEGVAPNSNSRKNLVNQLPSYYGKWYLLSIPLFAAFYHLSWFELQRGDQIVDGYFQLLYFSAVTITTLGYGDITPGNLPAMLLTGAQSVIGVGLIGLFLNALSHQHAADSQEEERKVMRQELREELLEDFEKVASKIEVSSQEMVSQVTGGDSYPVFRSIDSDRVGLGFRFFLYNEGAHYLNNLTLEVKLVEGAHQRQILTRSYPFVKPGTTGFRDTIKFNDYMSDGKSSYLFQIRFSARNGNCIQTIKFLKVEEEWLSASGIIMLHHDSGKAKFASKELEADSNFPRDSHGNIILY
jgi:hypothetical protein